MPYDEAIELLESALVFGVDPSLEPIKKACAAMGDPQKRYRCIQVAGTNGKTSTSRMIAAILKQEGLRTGLYLSPHLIEYPERMEVDGRVASHDEFARSIEAAAAAFSEAGIEATEFELLTAAALWLFAEEGVDVVVLECGLGGRWDATSVVFPEVSVITGVGLDHTHILGDTVEKIAEEKSFIIKPGSHAVLAPDLVAHQVFERRIAEAGTECTKVDPDAVKQSGISMHGMPAYQEQNLACAMTAVQVLLGRMPSKAVVEAALFSMKIPGRFEAIQDDPLVIIDAAHNPQSAEVLAREIERAFPLPNERPALLIGVLADKDAEGIVEALCPLFDRIVATRSGSDRAMPAQELAMLIEMLAKKPCEVASSIAEARDLLCDASVIATGSITVAGEVKSVW